MLSSLHRRYGSDLSKKKKNAGRRLFRIEPLELRTMLSAAGLPEITASPLAAQAVTNVAAPYTPAEIRQAYGFSNVSANGASQTIAIVDAYDDPNVLGDLKTFDAKYGLPDPTFKKVNQNGSQVQSQLPAANSGWGMEISLDVEWAHAVAPAASILLVEASSNSLTSLLTAVDYASSVAKVVSMSWGAGEFSGETSYDSHFSPQLHPGVTFIASSGDSGGQTIWPAVSPYVLGVGGTSFTIVSSSSGIYSYGSETAWSGSGGGYSSFESEPSWQYAVQSTGRRSSPDVAYDANPNTGFAVYDTYGYRGWYTVGGTSAGAPQWAGLVAIVNQVRAGNGSSSLSSALSNLYGLYSQQYSTDFHDITSGAAGRNRAGINYDLVTGLGSPQVQNIVLALAGTAPTVATNTARVSSKPIPSIRSLLSGSAGTKDEFALALQPLAKSTALDVIQETPYVADLPLGSLSIHISDDSAGLEMLATLPVGRQDFTVSAPVSNSQSGDQSDALTDIDGLIDSDSSAVPVAETGSGHAPTPDSTLNTHSIGLTAVEVPQVDLAATVSAVNRRREAVDAFMSQDSFGHVRQTAKTDVPALPASEKTDITLRAEALAAVALTLARVQLKKKTEPDEARRWRSRHQIDY